MSLNSKSTASAIALLIGGFIGASALVALADGSWTSAPSCTAANMPCNNAAAPINVSATSQWKSGFLGINYTPPLDQFAFGVTGGPSWFYGIGTNGLVVDSGATSTINSVLANTGGGNATWVATSTLGMGGGGFSNNYRAGKISLPSGDGPFHVTFSSPFPAGTNVIVTTSQNGDSTSGYWAVQQAGVANISASGFDIIFSQQGIVMNPATYTYVAVPVN